MVLQAHQFISAISGVARNFLKGRGQKFHHIFSAYFFWQNKFKAD